jgi:glycosyltransferase involved in cell wall biosynthesis
MFKEKLAIIIPTKDRPNELRRLLESISIQEVKPVQIVVVDGGDAPVENLSKKFSGLNIDYARVIPPSLTVQRNTGIRKVQHEATLVAFLDDDITLEAGALKNMMNFWESASEDTAGAAFNPTAETYEKPALMEKIFFVNTEKPGKILPSGFQSRPYSLIKNTQVEWLLGCSMLWRKIIFDEFMFDEWFTGYARYEEVDFAYRVGRRYKMFVAREARVKHPYDRLEDTSFSFSLGRMQVANRLYLARKNPGLSLLLCFWACFGLFINNMIKALLRRDKRYMLRSKGNVAGFFYFLLPFRVLK